MQLTFYIDVFFAINLFMNSLLLILVKAVCKSIRIKRQRLRILAGASVGAVLACISAVISFRIPVLSFLLTYGITSISMVLIAFGRMNKRRFCQTYLLFLFCSFLLGGMIQSISINYRNGSLFKDLLGWLPGGNAPAILLVVTSLMLTPVMYYGYSLFQSDRRYAKQLYDVSLSLSDHQIITCQGLMDTGNCLYDPLKGWPVIVADTRFLKSELDQMLVDNPSSFCTVPYSSVGKESGILYGFRIPQVIISNTEEKICTKNVVVALSDSGFVNDSEYRVLLHCDLLGFETK